MRPLSGIRVVELATWGMVPTTGAILSEWGAEVIKIEHPERADPMRTNVMRGRAADEGGVNYMWELHNRGKRGITLDLANPEGRAVFDQLLASADVFLTNLRTSARRKVGADVESVQGIKPALIYASSSGMGSEGPEATRGGYDTAAFWARSGIAYKTATAYPDADIPPDLPSAALGDMATGYILAGAIAAALVGRSTSTKDRGEVLETSLLATGMWAMRNEITACELFGVDEFFGLGRKTVSNPLNAAYRTRDGRFVQLVMLEADLHWPDLCRRIGREDVIDRPEFADLAARAANAQECIAFLESEFAKRDLDEWKGLLAEATGVWGVVQSPRETVNDPQAIANGYVTRLTGITGTEFTSVANPVKFDGETIDAGPAPEWGQHTDDVLAGLGIGEEERLALRISGAIM